MGRRRVDELQAGMVLAEDVLTPGGRFLMPKGTVLDAGHLKSLAAWALSAVCVRETAPLTPQTSTPEPQAPPSPDPHRERHEAADRLVRLRFLRGDTGQDPWPVLYRLAMDRELERLAAGEAAPEPRMDEAVRAAGENAPPASIEALLRDEPQLVSPPEVYLRVNEVLRDPHSTVDDAAAAIRHDPSLATKLLRLVNSSFYARTMRAVQGRFPAKIDSLSRAVMVVGARQLSTLALGVSVLPLFQDIPQSWIDMRGFWEHSVGCAVAAQALAAATGQVNPETAFVAGLLHDIGRIILLKQAPRHMAVAMRQALADRQPLVVAEQAILGFDHAALGGMLLGKWQFPTHLERMVHDHHDPRPGPDLAATAIVHCAEVVANAMAWGVSGSRQAPALSALAWEALGLDPQTFESLVPLMEASRIETMRGFFPDRRAPS